MTAGGLGRDGVPAPPAWWADGGGHSFVGRKEDLRTIDAAWRAAASGRRRVVLVRGEAGAGKTSLAAEASTRIAAEGAAVVVGSCLPDAPLPYEPFREPLRILVEAAGEAPGHDDVGALVGLDGQASTPQSWSEPAARTYDAVVAVLRRIALQQPLVVVLEDLHWATRSTLELLNWIVRRTADTRLLLVATARSTPSDVSDTFRSALAQLYRQQGIEELQLGGLDAKEIASLVTQELGAEFGPTPEVADRLLAQTSGNPFLIHEICRDWRRTEVGDGAGVRVPDSVRGLYWARISQLAAPERRVLELAAVLGDQFTVSMLSAVAGSGAEALSAVDRALEHGLLVALPDEEGYRFPHALARQAVVDLTSQARLAQWHGQIAEELEKGSARTLPEVVALAYHTQRALGRAERARDYLIDAAELAERTWAYAEAAQHYESAAELAATVAERHRLLLRSAEALQRASRYPAAMAVAAEVAEQAVDAETRLAAATLVESDATLLGGDHHTVRVLLDALGQYPADMADQRYLQALAGLSRAMGQVLDSAATFRLYDAVLAQARRSGDGRVVASALHAGLTHVFGRPDRTQAALQAARELGDLVRSRDARQLGSAAFFRCLLGLRSGNPTEVRAGVADYRIAHELGGHLWFEYWPEVVEFDLRFMRGDFAGAAALAPWLRDWTIRHTDQRHEIGHFGLQIFQIRRETGQLDDARHLVDGDESIAERWAPGLLALYTALGMAQPARRVLDAMADEGTLARNRRTEYLPAALAYLVEAAVFLADAEILQRLRPWVAEHAGLHLISDQFVALPGAADRYLGMVDAALGDADPLPRFEAAEALAIRSGFDVDLALTLTARARYLAQKFGPTAAEVVETAERARAIAAPIGQRRVLDALPGASPGRPVGSDSGLTARELEVLRLVCEGATNREIAEQLVISENTAANHVRAILIKTGSPNRTRAAILAVSKGWVPEP